MNPVDYIADLLQQLKACNQPAPACLSTQHADGFPNARFVDLKTVLDGHLLFGTDERSTKALEFLAVPQLALSAWWEVLQVQIRVRGTLHKASATVSDAIFSARHPTAKALASISVQSEPLDDVDAFQSKLSDFLLTANAHIQRPDTWWVYAIQPHDIEILTFSADRVHIRTRFQLEDGKWQASTLSP